MAFPSLLIELNKVDYLGYHDVFLSFHLRTLYLDRESDIVNSESNNALKYQNSKTTLHSI